MSQEIKQISQLQKKLSGVSEKQFTQLIANQLKKDFERAGVELPKEVPTEFATKRQLFDFAHQLFKNILKEQSHLLDSLLYLIDIPEKYVQHNFHDTQQSETSVEIILIREAQKVFLRKTYSP